MIIIPTRNDLDYYTFKITLDGADFNFTFTWNTRSERWHFDLADSSNSPIVSGAPVLCGWLILGRFRDTRLPTGDFIFVNVDGTLTDPGRYDLGTTCNLYYVEAADEG